MPISDDVFAKRMVWIWLVTLILWQFGWLDFLHIFPPEPPFFAR